MNKRGVALIICYMVIVALAILGAAFLIRSISERSVTSKYLDSTRALWLAEAGVNQAIFQLRNNYNDLSAIAATSLGGKGEYSATIISDGDNRTVIARGSVPSEAAVIRVERVIEVILKKKIPPGFYDYAIYAAGDLERKGNVNGDVIYAGTADGKYKDPQPASETSDPSISPLALLNFEQLRIISKGQNNYHDASQLDGPFPASFWYDEPNKIPNVVFLEGTFTLKGNDVVGGFFVVGGGGDVVYDATIAGTVTVNGCIYTRGNFTISGGGGADLNVAAVWAGGTTTLSGSSIITFNQEYMDAIEALGIDADVQVTSWRETQRPY